MALAVVDDAHPALDIPGHSRLECLAEGRRAEPRLRPRRSPDLQRRETSPHHAEPIERGQVAPVVDVQMGQEDLVELGMRHADRIQIRAGTRPEIEDEDIAIPQLNQPASRCLLPPRKRHPRAQRRNPHLVGPKLFARVVEIWVSPTLAHHPTLPIP